MTTYKIDAYHKIEVTGKENGHFDVTHYERMGGKWVQLGPSESWYSLADIKFEYGID